MRHLPCTALPKSRNLRYDSLKIDDFVRCNGDFLNRETISPGSACCKCAHSENVKTVNVNGVDVRPGKMQVTECKLSAKKPNPGAAFRKATRIVRCIASRRQMSANSLSCSRGGWRSRFQRNSEQQTRAPDISMSALTVRLNAVSERRR